MPKISIIVPVYKVEPYIHKCIQSILKQTFVDFELILVDDGSPDKCGSICDMYATIDSRVRVIHKKNGGLSDARNAGLDVAEGDYVGFVDSDDWIESDMYDRLYHLCLEFNADISTSAIKIWNNGQIKVIYGMSDTVIAYDSKTAIQYLYDGKLTGFQAWNKLYNRELFKSIRFPKGRIYEDVAVMYRLYDQANKIVAIFSPLYNYQNREFSITRSRFSENRFDVVPNYLEAYDYMESHYPEVCGRLNSRYFEELRNMIVDIVNENSILKNYRHIRRVGHLIRKNNRRILKNPSISILHKLLAQVLAWCPLLGVLFYRIRIINLLKAEI